MNQELLFYLAWLLNSLKEIALVKVHWDSKRGPELTWERKDQMRSKCPQLFVDSANASSSIGNQSIECDHLNEIGMVMKLVEFISFTFGDKEMIIEILTHSPYIGRNSLDGLLQREPLSDLYYLFGGFMDYLWSCELYISNFSPADRTGMFTKALPEDQFKYLVRRIGMRCLTPANLEVLTNETA
ncbi:hypothetical protein Tco_0307146 [Tanacetum coccineum]